MGINFFVQTWGNNAADYLAAEKVYNPKVDYTGCVIEIGFWRWKKCFEFVIEGMPEPINRLSFQHDVDVGDYSKESHGADRKYYEGVLAYANSLKDAALRNLWIAFGVNAYAAIRSWGEMRYWTKRVLIGW